jgi:UDP-glucose 4-epimerase
LSEAPRVRVLVTGAGGFLGGRIADALTADFNVVRMLRRGMPAAGIAIADLDDRAALERACAGIDLVVHCAGHAHAFGGRDDADLHERINHLGTRRLGEAAAVAGVRHLVFLSSVKAGGLPGDTVADEGWPVQPETPYGCAKRAAEAALAEISASSSLAVTSLRLAMVYGRGSRGNLERMLAGIRAGWFPPLPSNCGARSMVHVADALAAVRAVLDNPLAFGQTWIVTGPAAYSAAEVQELTWRLLGRKPPAWRVPATCLRVAARAGDVFGRLGGRRLPLDSQAVARLLDAEVYAGNAIVQATGWCARVTLDEGLRECLGVPAPESRQ